MSLRDELRAAVFNVIPKVKIVTYNGHQIEVRQPTVGDILSRRPEDNEDPAMASFRMMVANSYVPGTNERVFEETDIDVFKATPFSVDLQKLMEAINELTGVKTSEPTKSTE